MRGEDSTICGAKRAAQGAAISRLRFWLGTLVVSAFALLLSRPAHADSALKSGSPNGAALSASAFLDFRITVLPSLTLAVRSDGVRIQTNAGALVVQHENEGGQTSLLHESPADGAQLHRPVIDASLPTTGMAGTTLLTIATP